MTRYENVRYFKGSRELDLLYGERDEIRAKIALIEACPDKVDRERGSSFDAVTLRRYHYLGGQLKIILKKIGALERV